MPSEQLTEMLPVRMDDHMRQRLEAYAAKVERDKAWVIRKALREFLDRDDGLAGKGKSQPKKN